MRTATNDRSATASLSLAPGATRCQPAEVPRGTESAVVPASGPGEMRVSAGAASASGPVPARKQYIVVPLPAIPPDATSVCFANAGGAPLSLYGASADALHSTPFEVRVDWLGTARRRSSMGPTVARRMALMKAPFLGTWTFWLALAAAVGLGAAALLVRRRPVVVCFLVATLTAWVWAVVTPSLQVPDEVTHAAYVQYVAETGSVPRPIDTAVNGQFHLSQEESAAVDGIPFSYVGVPSWSPRRDRTVKRELDRPLGRVREAGPGPAANNPPLYYALEAIPYRIADSGDFFDRLLAMRLFSALLAGATAAFTYLFLRELLPATPWAWRTGALAVAFQPLAAFVAGGVNPDALLWAASAALTWLVARTFRRGLDMRTAVGIGASVAVALLTKGAGVVLVPPALLVLAVSVRRARAALRPAAAALAAAGLPWLAWVAASRAIWGRGAAGGVAAAPHSSIGGQLAYLWETYLPRLPGMPQELHFYPTYPLWQAFFQGVVGRFGYFQYGFSSRVDYLALAIALVLVGLAAVALVRARPALRRRLPELACYLALVLAVVVVIAVAGYHFRNSTGISFEQARYLFPLLALYGALFALAVRGAGRRFGPAVGTLLVVLVVAQNTFALLLTLKRYYL